MVGAVELHRRRREVLTLREREAIALPVIRRSAAASAAPHPEHLPGSVSAAPGAEAARAAEVALVEQAAVVEGAARDLESGHPGVPVIS